MIAILAWLDADQTRYLVASDGALFAVVAIALGSILSGRLRRFFAGYLGTAIYLAGVALAIYASRWPTFFVRWSLNNDEAQALAQALTALHHPIPWLGFDGDTCGPLTTYALLLPRLAGAPLGFASTRVVAVLLESGSLAALYAAVALIYGRTTARLAVLPPLAFYALTQEPDLIHYACEHSASLLAMLTMLALALCARRRPRWPAAFAIGLFAGMLPFTKIQAAPIALTLFAIGAIVVLGDRTATRRARCRLLGLTAGGALLFPTALLAVVAAHGAFGDFWISYVRSALAYVLAGPLPPSYLTKTPEFAGFFVPTMIVTALGALAAAREWRRLPAPERWALPAALAFLASALYAIFAPRRASLQYLLFGIMPAACAAASSLGIVLRAVRRAGPTTPRWAVRFAVSAAFVLATLGPQHIFDRPAYGYLGHLREELAAPADPVTAMLRSYVHPGEQLVIWGWRPQYVVFTGTILGTRDAISWYQYDENTNPYRAYYRARFIRDMEANRPQAFLDAGPDSFDFERKGRDGHEIFPQLAALIARDYRLVASVGPAGDRYRLYLRRSADSIQR
ncbi:MAG: hypothetical protein ACREM8_03655 [Vulcanimicrobiaceae bacterium]